MKILITGSTGFLGVHLTKSLIEDGHELVALKRRSSNTSSLSNCGSKLSFFDIEEGLETVFKIHDDFDLILHTATCYGNKGESLSELLTVNVILPLQLLEISQRYSKCPFINTDTYFSRAGDKYEYLANYVYSKTMFQKIGSGFSKENERTFLNLYLEHMYGPGDGDKKFITTIIKDLLIQKEKIQLTEGEQLRDFIHVNDVVSAYKVIINSMEKIIQSDYVQEFQVGSGEACTLKDFVILIKKLLSSESKLLFGELPYRTNEIMSSCADIEKLKSLGWVCNETLESGLESVISDIKNKIG